ncbi:MAG TPA: GspE/PulE family protein, partial [Candidatus Saccharimonadales bacterium]|nr:GspE/PulE family protein [Candidatus Saccharimonadales bacterium]
NYISAEDSAAAEQAAQDSAGYIDYLIRQELLSQSLLGQALAEGYKLPFADLTAKPPTKEQVAMIPEDTARAMRIVVIRNEPQNIAMATDAPEAIDPAQLKALFPQAKVSIAYTLPEYLETAFSLYEQPLATRFSEIIKVSKRVAPDVVDEIIKDALNFRASDIHFEPRGEEVVVRFRVDGNLREAGRVPKEYYENILNRIKVESGMRIDEHMAAQDGAMQRKTGEHGVDLRVSLVPTVEGEKVVMRVLGAYVQAFTFADIGLGELHRGIIERSIAKPFGMILTVGPTGSGKTTTLYALLKQLNRADANITTIEDPVEYKMAGTNQIQVREASNMTFAKGLRAIVRQDPDIILVGEIRDQETAEISVNAALTGHLLLSTFHANDAATAMPRLVDMGIEPFLLASTLDIIIAQRLVRRVCRNCRYSLPVSAAAVGLKAPGFNLTDYFNQDDNVYAGKGCSVCSGSGYDGRVALFEIIEITPEMQELLLHQQSSQDIENLSRKQGSPPMFDDGIAKVKNGTTTLSEVLRVVSPPIHKQDAT